MGDSLVNLRDVCIIHSTGSGNSTMVEWKCGNSSYVNESPAEVSRLIAEAQGDE